MKTTLNLISQFACKALENLRLRGSDRSVAVKKNAYLSLVLMVLNNAVGIVFVPVVIGLIEPVRFGIWITINSTLTWFSLLDIGLGGGLRTRLAQALAMSDDKLAKQYLSTAFAFIGSMVLIVMALFLLIYRHIDWVRVFNAPSDMAHELSFVMLCVVVLFLCRLTFQLINSVLMAFQLTAITTLASFCSHFLSLIVIFFLFKHLTPSLWAIAMIYSISPVIVLLATAVIFFSKAKYRQYSPSIKYLKIDSLSSIMSLGAFEFIDKVSGVAIITMTNIMISHIGTPADVVPYNISMRIVGLFVTIANIVTEPMTPAFTEAYVKNDHSWIKRVVRKMNYVSIFVVASLFISIPILKPVVELLLRGKVEISFTILVMAVLLSSQRIVANVYGRFITGIGKIRLVVLVTALTAGLFFPLVKGINMIFSIGVLSVIVSQLLVEMPVSWCKWRQATLIMQGKARGLWFK